MYQLVATKKSGGITTNPTSTSTGAVTLNFWGVYDDPSVYQPILDAYHSKHPNVTIVYSVKDPSLYEFISLNQLATQDGPDVWLIPSEWLPKHRDKLAFMPTGLMAKNNSSASPTPKKSLFAKASPAPSNETVYKQLFSPVTAVDNIIGGQVAALPLSVDTLGLYSNTALLQAAGITQLPTTWEAVVSLSQKLAKKDGVSLKQPAIGLGGSANISRSADILATLMIQNHTVMVNEAKTDALFNQALAKANGEPVQPGQLALDFYTSFASPTKQNYSWDNSLANDYQLFSQGQLPFLIDYGFRVRDLSNLPPGLTWQTSILPQIAGTDVPASMSTAMMVGVPIVSKHQAQAWDFVQFLTNETNALAYARAAGRPPARLALQKPELFAPAYQPFILQTAIASTWYRNDVTEMAKVFNQAIDSVLSGQTLSDVITKLTKQASQILRGQAHD